MTDRTTSKSEPGPGFLVSLLLIQQAVAAASFPISKFGLDIIEPFTFAFYRFLLSSAVLLLIVKLRKPGPPIEKKDYIKIFGLGALIIPFNQTLYLLGQSMTGAGHGALLFATVPIWVFLLAILHLKEKIVVRRVIGVVIGVAGVGVIMFSGAVEIGTEYLIGDLTILVAVIAWAYYTVFGKPLATKYGAIRVTAYALASGSALYMPFGFYRAMIFDYSGATLGGWLAIAYMALITSGVVYVLWYWVLKYMDASRTAVFHNVQPIIATAIAYLWLGEQLDPMFFIGGIVALGGVIIAEV